MIKPFLWSLLNTGGGQVITFAGSMAIARVAGPQDFGVVAIASATILIVNILVEAGFASTIIYDRVFSEDKASTILWLSLVLAGIAYITISFSAHHIALYFKMPPLEYILPIMGLSTISTSMGSVHAAIIARKLQFNKKAILAISASLISTCVGVLVAYFYSPLTGLILMFVLAPTLLTFFMWIFTPWSVQFIFRPRLLWGDIFFSFNIAISSLVDQIFKSSIPIFIGYQYGAESLGYFNRAEAIKNIAGQSIDKVVQKVAFPLLSRVRHNKKNELWYNHIIISRGLLFILTPFVWFIHKFSEAIVLLLFGPNWESSAPLLAIVIFGAVLMPMTSLNLTLLKSCGQTFFALFLKAVSLFLVLVIFLAISLSDMELILIALIGILGLQFVGSTISLKMLDQFPIKNYITDITLSIIVLISSIVVYQLLANFRFEVLLVNLISHLLFLFFISATFFWLFLWSLKRVN